jgi:hypothetical protein
MNEKGKERILSSMGLIKEGPVEPVLTEEQQVKESINNLIETFAICCNNLDLAITETTKIASKLPDNKRKIVSEGLSDIFKHLESSIAEARSILSFEQGSEAYRR